MSSEETKKDEKSTTTSGGEDKKATTATKAKLPGVHQPSAAEEGAAPYPDMSLGQKIHRLMVSAPFVDVPIPDDEKKEAESTTTTKTTETSPPKTLSELSKSVFEQIGKDLENPSLYRQLMKDLKENNDGATKMDDGSNDVLSGSNYLSEEQLKEMDEKNEKKLKELMNAIDDAKEQAGDMEVLDAKIAVARFSAKSLSKAKTYEAYTAVLEQPKISSGKKIDAYMECARIASFYHDTTKTDYYLERAMKLASDGGGGDWDRRNRLKVYNSLQYLLHRKTKDAASLLTDCIATFSCNEMCTYSEFTIYCVLTNMLHIKRVDLKKKILDGPEIRTVANEIPIIMKLVQSLYDCDYRSYLHAMVETEAILLGDRFLHRHADFWMRELHLLAYKQFLDAYQSVTLEAMSKQFGVSIEFCDVHASRFIASGRLAAKIDKYGGVIVTNRPDTKNAQYRDMIQKGDLLLNRIQKLARVVDL